MKPKTTSLKVGDWVEVRSKQEILNTLDRKGELDGMPFMPEMFAFCGQRFQVFKRAHKTCDTVFPVRGRRVHEAVHLDTRCNGKAHGGCQAGCLIFWKTAWLKPASGSSAAKPAGLVELQSAYQARSSSSSGCAESAVMARTRDLAAEGSSPKYICQATQLPYATKDLEWWDVRQYVEDYLSGNVGLWRILCGGAYVIFYALTHLRFKIGRLTRRFYDTFYPLWRGVPFPRKGGTIPDGQPTPVETLSLQPGEMVRVKSHDAILKTLNRQNRNRGMLFDAEEVRYCGGTYRVLRRVEKIINEKTGRMQEMKTPCIVLDSVVCESRYSDCRMFCPRSIYSYWREIWLERVEANGSDARRQDDRQAGDCRELVASGVTQRMQSSDAAHRALDASRVGE
jgi:hypothetical protein